MRHRSLPAPRTARAYEDTSFWQLLFRYVWPFWLLRDASRGDRYARAAAYRHNREMRVYLPAYLMRWSLSSAMTLTIAAAFGSLSSATAGSVDIFVLIAAGWGIAFACSACVLAVTTYIYLYLSRNEA